MPAVLDSVMPELVELRHALHAEPEIGLHLPATQEKVIFALGGLPVTVTRGERLSSVVGVLRGAHEGPAVLLRADMDALPVTERTGLPYASRTEGAMHACGHDLHTTMLVGAAHLLAARRHDLRGSVILMFQPGEEGYEGARAMLAEGVLHAAHRRVVAAYGLHVATAAPVGHFFSRPGALTAAADTVDVVVRGRGGHGSMPHTAADPIPAAAALVGALQTMITRTVSAVDPVVLTVGKFHAGTTSNVIPDAAELGMTLRTCDDATRAAVIERIRTLCAGTAAAHGLSADVTVTPGYPATVNDPKEFAHARDVTIGQFGEDSWRTSANPIMASEDFSRVLNEVPGAFVNIGASGPGTDLATVPANHSPRAVFDDAVIPVGSRLLAELALRRLSAN